MQEMEHLATENVDLSRESSELKSLNAVLRAECQDLIENLGKVQKVCS